MSAIGAFKQKLLAAAVACCVAVPALAVVQARPAAALTADENFVIAAFDDFMMRGPSDDELTLWTTYLGSHARPTMVSALLDSDEFAALWVMGTHSHYLQLVDAESSQFISEVSALESSGDFVAAEVSVLASADYYTLHGSTNTGYVSALYDDVFQRAADPTGLAYWVGQLNSNAVSRSYVASHFIRSTEAANRRVGGTAGATSCAATELTDNSAVASGAYCIVLDRLADSSGFTYWSGQLAGTAQLPALWASLAGSTEYYNNAQL